MPARKLTEEQANAELLKRFALACERVTPEAIADGHPFQLRVMRSRATSMLFMCSRRAGKSRVACGLLLLTAIATAKCSCLYLALTKGQAQKIFTKHWKPMLRKFKIPCSNAGQTTTFPNGATVVFGGTDDLKTVTHLLGDSMASGIAILDEQQDDPGVLQTAAEVIFSPMLNETTAELPTPGRMVISGTVPDLPVGYFYQLWSENYDEEKQQNKPDSEWDCYTWSRFDNPHEHKNEWHLENHLRKYRLKIDDPAVQRAWFGRRVWARDASCFRYRSDVNNWTGQRLRDADPDRFAPFRTIEVRPPTDIDTFWIGIHPVQAASERFALTLFGTSNMKASGMWQVAEAVCAAGVVPFESEYIAIVKDWRERYGRIARIVREPVSGQEIIDVQIRSHGLLIESAIKGAGNLRARVDRVADLLNTDTLHVLAGSALEADLIAAKWNKKGRAAKRWEFDQAVPPSVAEAATYIIPAWTAVRPPAPPAAPQTEDQHAAQQAREAHAKKFSNAPQRQTRPKRPDPWARMA